MAKAKAAEEEKKSGRKSKSSEEVIQEKLDKWRNGKKEEAHKKPFVVTSSCPNTYVKNVSAVDEGEAIRRYILAYGIAEHSKFNFHARLVKEAKKEEVKPVPSAKGGKQTAS